MTSAVERVERELTLLFRRSQKVHLQGQGGPRVLDRSAYAVLVRLHDDGPLHLSDLAAAFGLDLSTLSRQVAALRTAGYVGRERDPVDRRAWLLTVTPSGQDAVRTTRARRRAALRELFAAWPSEDVETLGSLLERFNTDLTSLVGDASTPANQQTGQSTARPGDSQ